MQYRLSLAHLTKKGKHQDWKGTIFLLSNTFFILIKKIVWFLISQLFRIKFRLDDTSDITWYNDLISPLPESKDCNVCGYSESVLFSCETFDVHEDNPRLVFGAIAGHCIEFNVSENLYKSMWVIYIILFCIYRHHPLSQLTLCIWSAMGGMF